MRNLIILKYMGLIILLTALLVVVTKTSILPENVASIIELIAKSGILIISTVCMLLGLKFITQPGNT